MTWRWNSVPYRRAGLKGVDLVRFNADGKIVEFEVMVRPIKALQALGTRMGERIGPQLAQYKAAAAAAT